MSTSTATPTMPPIAADHLDESAQALIDARLDTIERMLFGQTPRADRLAIVREVETQIHDLLGQRNPDDTDRDAVIAALARLDPPEAYLPDEVGETPRVTRPVGRFPNPRPTKVASSSGGFGGATLLGKSGGIIGIVATVLIMPAILTLYLAFANTSDGGPFYVFAALCLLINILSILAITLSATDKLRNPWSVIGLTTGIVSFLPGFGGTMWFLITLLS